MKSIMEKLPRVYMKNSTLTTRVHQFSTFALSSMDITQNQIEMETASTPVKTLPASGYHRSNP